MHCKIRWMVFLLFHSFVILCTKYNHPWEVHTLYTTNYFILLRNKMVFHPMPSDCCKSTLSDLQSSLINRRENCCKLLLVNGSSFRARSEHSFPLQFKKMSAMLLSLPDLTTAAHFIHSGISKDSSKCCCQAFNPNNRCPSLVTCEF